MKIKLIVFDLDDTLLDTTQLLIPIARTPAFEERIRQPLPLMPGALENLEYLKDKYILTLLTQGRLDAQMQKVKSLGIGHFFQEQFFADPTRGDHKGLYFERIIRHFSIHPSEGLSIGNRRSTDIREAKKVGMQTCHFAYGEHLDEPQTCPEDIADFDVHSHRELIQVCRL